MGKHKKARMEKAAKNAVLKTYNVEKTPEQKAAEEAELKRLKDKDIANLTQGYKTLHRVFKIKETQITTGNLMEKDQEYDRRPAEFLVCDLEKIETQLAEIHERLVFYGYKKEDFDKLKYDAHKTYVPKVLENLP